ncbi:hypothetical protein [Lysobacter sp. A378]
MDGLIVVVVTALVMAAWAWKGAADLRPWLLAASVEVVVWQAGRLLIRQRYRLFGAPAGALWWPVADSVGAADHSERLSP